MPTQTITHKSWCRKHEPTSRESTASPVASSSDHEARSGRLPAHRVGDMWAAQQLGVDDEPVVVIEYGSGGIAMKIADLSALRGAIDELIEVLRTRP